MDQAIKNIDENLEKIQNTKKTLKKLIDVQVSYIEGLSKAIDEIHDIEEHFIARKKYSNYFDKNFDLVTKAKVYIKKLHKNFDPSIRYCFDNIKVKYRWEHSEYGEEKQYNISIEVSIGDASIEYSFYSSEYGDGGEGYLEFNWKNIDHCEEDDIDVFGVLNSEYNMFDIYNKFNSKRCKKKKSGNKKNPYDSELFKKCKIENVDFATVVYTLIEVFDYFSKDIYNI